MRFVLDGNFRARFDICQRHNVQVDGTFFHRMQNFRVRSTRAPNESGIVAIGPGVHTNFRPIVRQTIEKDERTRVPIAALLGIRCWDNVLLFVLSSEHIFASYLGDSIVGRQVQCADQNFATGVRNGRTFAIQIGNVLQVR